MPMHAQPFAALTVGVYALILRAYAPILTGAELAHGTGMELRHLRYFLAVAEAGSLTVAAERTLHTSQPSLSRQIQDLENEVGVPLFKRTARGVELTASGQLIESSQSPPAT